MSRGYQVIDADGHIVEPHDMWDRYLDPMLTANQQWSKMPTV